MQSRQSGALHREPPQRLLGRPAVPRHQQKIDASKETGHRATPSDFVQQGPQCHSYTAEVSGPQELGPRFERHIEVGDLIVNAPDCPKASKTCDNPPKSQKRHPEGKFKEFSSTPISLHLECEQTKLLGFGMPFETKPALTETNA